MTPRLKVLAIVLALATFAGFVVMRRGADPPVRLLYSYYSDLSDLEPLQGARVSGNVFVAVVGDSSWGTVRPTLTLDKKVLVPDRVSAISPGSLRMSLDTFRVGNGQHVLTVGPPSGNGRADHAAWTGRAAFTVANEAGAGQGKSRSSQSGGSGAGKGGSVERISTQTQAQRRPVARDAGDIPLSITSNCSRNVTAALNSVIAALPNGTRTSPALLRFGRNACYRIDDKLVVRDRRNIVFDGRGATFKAFGPGHSDRKQWQVYGGSNITFKNMTVLGVNTSVGDGAYNKRTEWQHNFDFWGTQGLLIDSVVGKYAWGDFVGLEADYRACCSAKDMPPVRNAVIRNSRFYGAGRMGISTNYIDGLRIENNTIDRVRWSSIDIEVEDLAWSARDIVIRNNRIGDVWHSFIANSGYDAPTENVVVSGNVMLKLPGTNQPPIHIDGGTKLRENWTITKNRFQTRTWMVWMDHATRVFIRDNYGRSPGKGNAAVHIQNSDVGSVIRNDFVGMAAAAEVDAASESWDLCGNMIDSGDGYTSPKVC